MKIVFERITKRRLNKNKIRAQIDKIVQKGLAGQRGRGWVYEIKSIKQQCRYQDQNWSQHVTVILTPTSDRQSILDKITNIITKFAEVGRNAAFINTPWVIAEPSGFSEMVEATQEVPQEVIQEVIQEVPQQVVRRVANSEIPKSLGEINLIRKNEFDHIYDRNSQIARIFNSLELAKITGFNKRSHCLLNGPPGCGKTEILESFKKMLGKKDEAYISFDGSNMTRAGVVEQIINSSAVPPVLVIEEIEKCEEQHLRWLMSIMDSRGEVRRTNFRVGTQARDVRMVVLATANNTEVLERYMGGAISSRFDAKIYCPRPSEKVMRQILAREIKNIEQDNLNGNPLWIDKTIEFLYIKWGITDPRNLITFCTSGRDKLLTGEAQQEWEDTLDPNHKKKFLVEKRNREKEDAAEFKDVVNG